MLKRVRLIIAATLCSGMVFAQTGLKIHVIDKKTQAPVSFAAVGVEKNGVVIISAQADIDGYAELKPLDPDKYDVRVEEIGYHTALQSGLQVSQDVLSRYTIEMSSEMDTSIHQVTIFRRVKTPIISVNTQSGGTADSTDIHNLSLIHI